MHNISTIHFTQDRENTDLEQFAHICAHDLKEPLRGIKFQSQMLLEDYAPHLPDDAKRKLERIQHLASRMQKQITGLLHFACIGTQDMPMEMADLNIVIQETIDELLDVLQQKNAAVAILTVLPQVKCNRLLVQSVFLNLLSNAVKYNDNIEKRIEISCQTTRGHQGRTYKNVFCVRDNGIGIEEQFHTEIFTIFKRLNPDRMYGEGTGAGLTLVQKIIERHGGVIWVESKLGQGSSFYFTLEGDGAHDKRA